MTTIHPPAQGFPGKVHADLGWRMHRLATLPVVQRELKPSGSVWTARQRPSRLGGAQWRYGVRRPRVWNP